MSLPITAKTIKLFDCHPVNICSSEIAASMLDGRCPSSTCPRHPSGIIPMRMICDGCPGGVSVR